MTNESPERNDEPVPFRPFDQVIAPFLTGLLYPSESDEAVEPVSCYLEQAGPLTVSQVKDWLLLPPSVYVEEVPENDFWEPVTTEQDWYGADEKKRTARFQELRQLLEGALSSRQVFRVGESEVNIYLLGQQTDGVRAGIRTLVIET